jgi:hypothetical protein
MPTYFIDSVTRDINQKVGESPSVRDFDPLQTCHLGMICSDGTVSSDMTKITGASTRFAASAGLVVNLTVLAGGSGYVTADTVTITGAGTGAQYTPTLSSSGAVTGFTLVAPGSGYDQNTTTAAMTSTSGTGAVIDVQVSTHNAVGDLVYVWGSGPTSRTLNGATYNLGTTSYTSNANDPTYGAGHVYNFGPGAFNEKRRVASLADQIGTTGVYQSLVFDTPLSNVPPASGTPYNAGAVQYAWGPSATVPMQQAVAQALSVHVTPGVYLVDDTSQMQPGQTIFSQARYGATIIGCDDTKPIFWFGGSWLIQGSGPEYQPEITNCPSVTGLQFLTAHCAVKFGYFWNDQVIDPLSGSTVAAGSLVATRMSYLSNCRVEHCRIQGSYNWTAYDSNRLSMTLPASQDELIALGGVGVHIFKGVVSSVRNNDFRNLGVGVMSTAASHAVIEANELYYCGRAIWHWQSVYEGDSEKITHNKLVGCTRRGHIAGSGDLGLNGSIIDHNNIEGFLNADGTCAGTFIYDAAPLNALWIRNNSMASVGGTTPTSNGNSIELSPNYDVWIENNSHLSPPLFHSTNWAEWWKERWITLRDNSYLPADGTPIPFQFPSVRQADYDPRLFRCDNPGNYGGVSTNGALWPWQTDSQLGANPARYAMTEVNTLNPSAGLPAPLYKNFILPETGHRRYQLVITAKAIPQAGQADDPAGYGYLTWFYNDETIPTSLTFGVQLGQDFARFENTGQYERRFYEIDIPATAAVGGTTYTLNCQANPVITVQVNQSAGSTGATGLTFPVRVYSMELLPIEDGVSSVATGASILTRYDGAANNWQAQFTVNASGAQFSEPGNNPLFGSVARVLNFDDEGSGDTALPSTMSSAGALSGHHPTLELGDPVLGQTDSSGEQLYNWQSVKAIYIPTSNPAAPRRVLRIQTAGNLGSQAETTAGAPFWSKRDSLDISAPAFGGVGNAEPTYLLLRRWDGGSGTFAAQLAFEIDPTSQWITLGATHSTYGNEFGPSDPAPKFLKIRVSDGVVQFPGDADMPNANVTGNINTDTLVTTGAASIGGAAFTCAASSVWLTYPASWRSAIGALGTGGGPSGGATMTAVASGAGLPLSTISISNPPTQAQVQDVQSKLNLVIDYLNGNLSGSRDIATVSGDGLVTSVVRV